jgi:hypothetical protein
MTDVVAKWVPQITKWLTCVGSGLRGVGRLYRGGAQSGLHRSVTWLRWTRVRLGRLVHHLG